MTASPPLDGPSRFKQLLVYWWALLVGLLLLPLDLYLWVIGVRAGVYGTTELMVAVPLVVVGVQLARRAGEKSVQHGVYLFTAVVALVVLPCAGLAVDAMGDDCRSTCFNNYRPLAIPEVFGLIPLQVAIALAFFLSQRRPEALSPRLEAAIVTGLFVGIVLHSVLAVQFIPGVPLAIFVLPLPVLTPYLTLPLLIHQLLGRLRARGSEAVGRGLLGVPVVLGFHWVVSAALFSSATGGVDAFLRTCSYPLSSLPLPPSGELCNGHYLCTIAAQGTPALVRPFRWGTRRGQRILVNRQLALANAFEDLLHERWPSLGRLARRTYDALALPLTGLLSRRWVANVLYVVMKPAEVLFLAALLFFDPGDPEARVDRMYR